MFQKLTPLILDIPESLLNIPYPVKFNLHPYNIEGKITKCRIGRKREFFVNFRSTEGKITYM